MVGTYFNIKSKGFEIFVLWMVIFVQCLSLCQPLTDVSQDQTVTSDKIPFLVLVEIKETSGEAELVNGCLASLSWVLVLSPTLAELPSGTLNSSTSVLVYAGLTSINDLLRAPKREAISISRDVNGSNDNFPNLVLLKLKTAFERSKLIGPVKFNIGMLESTSAVVGWASVPRNATNENDADNYGTVQHVISVRVHTVEADECDNRWVIVESKQQICAYEAQPQPLRLAEGALLVDRGLVTAIKQFDSYIQSPKQTPVALFVKMSFYMNWVQMVIGLEPKTGFLRPVYDSDGSKEVKSSETAGDTGSLSQPKDLLLSFLPALVVISWIYHV